MTSQNRTIFSSKRIQDYIDCERRYELRYVLNQSWPAIISEPILEIENKIAKGNEFHFLVHQFYNGVPVSYLKKNIQDNDLSTWLDNFIKFNEELDAKDIFSEIRLNVPINNHLLSAVFDLVYVNSKNEIGIIDWKTSQFFPSRATIAARMQTILYPFIMFESSAELFSGQKYPHESISLKYWYPTKPSTAILFPYSSDVHENNNDFIHRTIIEITNKKPGNYELTEDQKRCRFCQYRSLCGRGSVAGNIQNATGIDIDESMISIDFDRLPEISFKM